jgi:WD40 repeat protein
VLLLASTSADPHVRLWECHHPSTSPQQQQQQDVQGCSLQEQQLQARFGAAAWRVQQPVHVGRQIQHCVALATLPEDPHCVLMATGGTDSTVRLYVREDSSCAGMPNGHAGVLQDNLQDSLGVEQSPQHLHGPCFQLQCQLKGHENWVKGVSFQHVQESAGPHSGQHGCVSLLLASAGQDRYGRIWCISTDPNRSNAAADGAGGIGGAAAAGDDFLRKMITR